jgi:hypothetical protein
MKRTLSTIMSFVFVVSIFSNYAIGQSFPTDKGSTNLMGKFLFSSSGGDLYSGSDGNRLVAIEFDPAFGYFVSPGFSIGGQILYESLSQGDASLTTWGIGPELTYYIGGSEAKESIKGTTLPFLHAAFFYTNSSWDSGSSSSSTSGTKIRFGGGVMHLITNTVGLFGVAAYDIDNKSPENGDSESGNQFGVYAGFMIYLY